MIRQDIRIGDYTNKGISLTSYKFIVDLYKAGVDFKENIKKNYVMVRKYSIVNDVVYDSDIYIIERDIISNPELSYELAYPVTNGNFVGFSSNATSFNDNLSDKNYFIGGDEVYDIYEKNGDSMRLATVPCDKIRIYHPNNKTTLKSVIYVDMQIRGVHFHILCRPYETYETNAEADFESEHIKYSEFIECWIPNMEWLMSGAAYYQERLTKIESSDSSLIYYQKDGDKIQRCYAALRLFSLPFRIVDEDNLTFKRYEYDSDGDVAHNYITWPIRITIAPYTYIDSTTHLYINDSGLMMNSDVMQEEARMTLQASLGFDENGNHAVIAKFNYPDKNNYNSFVAAYEHFYNVDLNEYEGIVEYDEDDEDDYIEQKQCGCILQVYSDIYMTRKVGQFIYDIDDPERKLDDFAFQTAGMFECWEQLPSILVMQCKFVDRWLGNVIKSNPIVISESSFKYFINKTDNSVVSWTGNQNIYNTPEDIYKKIKEAEDKNKAEDKKMDISYINFIDKITCTVRKKSDVNDIQSNRANTRVLYKPIFFRTQDLQSISIRNGIKQNIGINLSEYMTKVETFRLKIGNVNVSESARNDIYVIFSIDASSLGSNSGTYHISNQDDEYISSGKYTVIE